MHGIDLLVFAALTTVASHRVFMDVYLWVVLPARSSRDERRRHHRRA